MNLVAPMLLWLVAGQAPPVVQNPIGSVAPHEHEETPTADLGEVDELKRWLYSLEARVQAQGERLEAAEAEREELTAAAADRVAEDEAREEERQRRALALEEMEQAAVTAAELEQAMALGEWDLEPQVEDLRQRLEVVAVDPQLLPPTVRELAATAHDQVVSGAERLENSDLFQARDRLTRANLLLQLALSQARATPER